MSMLACIRSFFRTCPLLDEDQINVDFLGTDGAKYNLNVKPGKEVVKTYVDGGTERQLLFDFVSREAYGSDFRQNTDNCAFYEALSAWLEEQSKSSTLPQLDGGREAIRIETLSNGYAFLTGEKNARYQIQCRLLYYQGG